MSDRINAELVKWGLWNLSIVAGLVIISWPPGYPLRVWKWQEHENRREEHARKMREAWDRAMGRVGD